MKNLFEAHIKQRVSEARSVMEEESLDFLFIESGFPDYYFLDDQPTFFKVNPHFNFFCPDPGQGHILKISKEQAKPTLFFHIPDDFWHEVSSLTDDFWEDSFDIKVLNDFEKAWKDAAEPSKKCAVVSPDPKVAQSHGCVKASESLIAKLHWLRGRKTEYEIECIRLANESAARGHKKAHELFLTGASEWQIFMEYLFASDQRESELPYNSIVGLDDHSAVLHYQFPKKDGGGRTFLIDAGARHNGYCSDITRTYTQDFVNASYKAILKRIEENQRLLCEMVRPGVNYVDIHRESYHQVADILVDFKIFKGSKDQALELKLPFQFYPHGIGHPLGLQVHDVGAKQGDPSGKALEQPEDFPYLRTLRQIQENDVLTIEPGFYFIPLLLKPLRQDEKVKNLIDWELIDQLIPNGGIRIEDNVVARANGPENLTRPFLP